MAILKALLKGTSVLESGAQGHNWLSVRHWIEGMLIQDSLPVDALRICLLEQDTLSAALSTGLTQEDRKSSQHD